MIQSPWSAKAAWPKVSLSAHGIHIVVRNRAIVVRKQLGGADHPIVQRRDEQRLVPPVAVSRAADPLGIDFRPRLQIVNGPHAVPNEKAGGCLAQRDAAQADGTVAAHAPYVRPAVFVERLGPFALVDGVVHQPRHAVEGQQRTHHLVVVMPLCFRIVAHRHNYAGIRRLESLRIGQEQQRRDVMPRLALEENLLHVVAHAHNLARHLGIQRRSLRQPANGLQKSLPHVLLIRRDLLRRFPLFVLCLPAPGGQIELLGQVSAHHAAGRAAFDLLRRNVQVSAPPGEHGEQKHCQEHQRRT